MRRSQWPPFVFALLGAVFIQIGTNYVNDALDFKKGADTHTRLGPLRVTQAGLLDADAVLRGAYVCFGLAALCGIPLILRGGWPIAIVGVASIVAAYAYTGGPYPLAYHGLGELFVMIFFGFTAVCGSFYLQRLTLDATAWIGGFAVGSLAVVILAINNLRDIDNDRASNKRTLAARFGAAFARTEIVVFALAPFVCVAAIAYLRHSTKLLLPMLASSPQSRCSAIQRQPLVSAGACGRVRLRLQIGSDIRHSSSSVSSTPPARASARVARRTRRCPSSTRRR